ncbi:MAG: beta-N-acetylhexosaminidase [Cyclobacteriaceae bacterium]
MILKSLKSLIYLISFISLTACSTISEQSQETEPTEVALIPLPTEMNLGGESFVLTDESKIILTTEEEGLKPIADYLGSLLRPSTGFALPIEVGKAVPQAIVLSLKVEPSLGKEGYTLKVDDENIHLEAYQVEGLFRGIQSLRQLLPARIENTSLQQGPWFIPALSIKDQPAYAYRGAMLDIARHFFGPEDIKRFIDLMTLYKLNALHLHLSDDQGWRIEIKSWPKLATYGGSTAVGGDKGGYLTQEEYRDIVSYAAERFITIIPEIDMPGHTNAALAAYPELNCQNRKPELYTGIEVGFSTLCIDNELTYRFVDDVVGELAAITEGPYIHIGGDESHVTEEEDYIRFINRAQEIVKSHGKKVIGWDEIANAALLPSTVVQHWADTANVRKAVVQGASVIMSPASRSYMDMKYDSTTNLGLNWAGFTEVDDAYQWDPAELAEGVEQADILGIEAPLWTETIRTMDDIEYMVFPRLPGYAEIGWTPVAQRNWESYRKRLAAQADRFQELGIDFYHSELVPWPGER